MGHAYIYFNKYITTWYDGHMARGKCDMNVATPETVVVIAHCSWQHLIFAAGVGEQHGRDYIYIIK
jgi:hypothetical protein